MQYFPDFDGTKDSKAYNDQEESEELSSDDVSSENSNYQYGKAAPEDAPWKNQEYHRLPPNV